MELKRSPLYEEHRELGANFGEFAGWEMPLSYGKPQEEVMAVRTKAGLFDISHMGRIVIWGADPGVLLQRTITANLERLGLQRSVYTLMSGRDGSIVDDLIIYKVNQLFLGATYILAVNASNTEKVLDHLKSFKQADLVIDDRTMATAMLALQGPGAEEVLKKLANFPTNSIPEKHNDFSIIRWQGISLLISRTGYTGEDGFEIILPADRAATLWQQLQIKPIGLIARDILRLEAGLPLYGHEISEKSDPRQKLVGFEVVSGRIARHSYSIMKNGAAIGFVTSGCFSPTLQKSIGMGYVDSEFAQPGQDIEIDIRGTRHRAAITPLPFYRRLK
jgi:aminomethyltransferase